MTTDAFTAQIVRLVREMPDDAILALVKNQLGAVAGARPAASAAVAAPARRAPAKRRASKARKAAAPKAAAPIAAAPKAAPAPKKVKVAKAKKAAKKAKAKVAKAKVGRPAKRAGRAPSADRAKLLATVERIIKTSSGMSASEVAKSANVPQSRVVNALKELKLAKRIFQGGDRRFARYAGDPRTASQASELARQSAAGPILKGRRRR